MRDRASRTLPALLGVLFASSVAAAAEQGGQEIADAGAMIGQERAQLDEVLAALSQRFGYAFVFDSRTTRGLMIGPVMSEAAPIARLEAELGAADLVLHRITGETFAIARRPPAEAEYEKIEAATIAASPSVASEIIVTGTRIANAKADSNGPYVAIDNAFLAPGPAPTVEERLNLLPQTSPSFSAQSNNPGANGRAFVDLRGLGPQRTLVLIDGRRGMISTANGLVDLNTIPATLIERVDVVTGGAAAAYGPDAVAGVVNFVMKKSVDGLVIDTGYRVTEHGDASLFTLDATLGGDFADGRGEAVLAAGYLGRGGLYTADRPFAAESGVTRYLPGGAWLANAGPPSEEAVADLFGADMCDPSGGVANWSFNADGSPFCTGAPGDPTRNVVGYDGPLDEALERLYPDAFGYDFAPHTRLVLPMDRYTAYSRSEFELSPSAALYGSVSFTRYSAEQELAPAPAPTSFNPFSSIPAPAFSIPTTNPFIHPDLAALLASRNDPPADFLLTKRFTALGGRIARNTHQVGHGSIGVSGDAGKWSYDAHFSHGRAMLSEKQDGNVAIENVQRLLDAPDGGASICEGGFNPFGNAPLSPACRDYIGATVENATRLRQTTAEASVSRAVAETPAGAVEALIGASWRRIGFSYAPDPALAPGRVAGFNSQEPLKGDIGWKEFFAEIDIPLLADRPFVQRFAVNGGWRLTANGRTGAADSWKATADWRVNDAVRFRGGVQHAIRSPSIPELFSPLTESFPFITDNDPCNTTYGATEHLQSFRAGPDGERVAALCAAQSPAAGASNFNQPANQARALSGGNPDLEPENAQSWTAGFVLRGGDGPWLSRASLAVDYWSISLKEAIAAPDAISIIQHCFNKNGANPDFDPDNEWCRLFERDTASGGIFNIRQNWRNQARHHHAGVDVDLRWGLDLAEFASMRNAGAVDLRVLATWRRTATKQLMDDAPERESAGTIGESTGHALPRFEGIFAAGYALGDVGLQANARYVGAMEHRISGHAGVPATWYLDLSARWTLSERARLRFGVANLLDQQPRTFSPSVQAMTDPSVYDVLGRSFFVGASLNL